MRTARRRQPVYLGQTWSEHPHQTLTHRPPQRHPESTPTRSSLPVMWLRERGEILRAQRTEPLLRIRALRGHEVLEIGCTTRETRPEQRCQLGRIPMLGEARLKRSYGPQCRRKVIRFAGDRHLDCADGLVNRLGEGLFRIVGMHLNGARHVPLRRDTSPPGSAGGTIHEGIPNAGCRGSAA